MEKSNLDKEVSKRIQKERNTVDLLHPLILMTGKSVVRCLHYSGQCLNFWPQYQKSVSVVLEEQEKLGKNIASQEKDWQEKLLTREEKKMRCASLTMHDVQSYVTPFLATALHVTACTWECVRDKIRVKNKCSQFVHLGRENASKKSLGTHITAKHKKICRVQDVVLLWKSHLFFYFVSFFSISIASFSHDILSSRRLPLLSEWYNMQFISNLILDSVMQLHQWVLWKNASD